MLVAIRADASTTLGTGHIMRCLALVGRWAQQGAKIVFVSRELPGNLNTYLETKGYPVHRLPGLVPPDGDYSEWLRRNWESDARMTAMFLHSLPGKVDRLVVDHYGLDQRWERYQRPCTREIMVIDDLADRVHDCDRLLDQNYYNNGAVRYQGLVPAHCELLLGPGHALLRPEFYAARRSLPRKDGTVRRMLIEFGGSDPTGETGKALQALQIMGREEITVDLVVGSANPRKEELRDVCSSMRRVCYHCQTERMAELMAQADLALGAGGTTTWERLFLRLPAITVAVAQNQVRAMHDLAATGSVLYLGWHTEVTPGLLAETLRGLLDDPARVAKMRNDGERVLGIMGNGLTP